jgi:hypothetical protein
MPAVAQAIAVSANARHAKLKQQLCEAQQHIAAQAASQREELVAVRDDCSALVLGWRREQPPRLTHTHREREREWELGGSRVAHAATRVLADSALTALHRTAAQLTRPAQPTRPAQLTPRAAVARPVGVRWQAHTAHKQALAQARLQTQEAVATARAQTQQAIASKSTAYEQKIARALSQQAAQAEESAAAEVAQAAAAARRQLEEELRARHRVAWAEREKAHAAETQSWRAQLGAQRQPPPAACLSCLSCLPSVRGAGHTPWPTPYSLAHAIYSLAHAIYSLAHAILPGSRHTPWLGCWLCVWGGVLSGARRAAGSAHGVDAGVRGQRRRQDAGGTGALGAGERGHAGCGARDADAGSRGARGARTAGVPGSHRRRARGGQRVS